MNTIVPAIIPQSFDHLGDSIALVKDFAKEIQIDIVDGQFVPFTSWPYRGGSSVMTLHRFTDEYLVEVDLMIAKPEDAIPFYIEAGVKKVVLHMEGVTDLSHVREYQRRHPFQLGLSIKNDSPIELLTRSLEEGDYVQLMGIGAIGSQGQPFDERVLISCTQLRAQYPDLVISIDGSVNMHSLPLLKEAGANRFVSGSAILSAQDPEGAFRALTLL